MQQQPNQTIQQLCQLPPLVKIQLFKYKNLDQFQKQGNIYKPLSELHSLLSNRFSNYEVNLSNRSNIFQYIFKFPSSKFQPNPDNKNRPMIQNQNRPQFEENTFRNKLSKQQLQNIFKDGTFLVASTISNLPYKWKLHPYLIEGSENILQNWYQNLASSYHQLRQIEKRFTGETLSIKKNFQELRLYPKRMLNLFVGVKQMRIITNPDYQSILQKGFLLQKYNKYFNIQTKPLYQLIYFPILLNHHEIYYYNSQRQEKLRKQISKINQFDSVFDKNWESCHRSLIKQYKSKQQIPDGQQVTRLLKQEKIRRYQNAIKQDLPPQFHEQIFLLMKIFNVVQILKERKINQLNRVVEQKRKQLKQKHRIRSHNRYFMQQQLQKFKIPLQKALQQQFWKNLEKQLNFQLFQDYLKYRSTYNTNLEKIKKKLPIEYGPSRIFYSTYKLFPPYQIKTTDNRYFLIRQKQLQVDTSQHFWKFRLYYMRVYSWTRNLFFYFIANSWVGPFGLKVLLSTGQFNYDQYIDYYTGVIHHKTRNSLLKQFSIVLQGISQSRKRFQDLPDTGFFGKNLSRIFNYIECYIFRFLFVGIILLLIIKPILILINSLLSLFIALTSWFWTPCILIITYLFNIFIFQFEIDQLGLGMRGRGSERYFPLINTPLMIILNLIRILFFLISSIILHPLVALVFSLLTILRRVFRTMSDVILFQLIKLLARSPARDTKIAWKISGPGLSRHYYYSLKQSDIHILIIAELEKKFLQQYSKSIIEKINRPLRQHTNLMNNILNLFDSNYSNTTSRISQTTNYLIQMFNVQKSRHQYRYPYLQNPNMIRFTQQELQIYFDNSVKIIKNWITKNDCSKWIFKKYDSDQNDFQALSKNLWITIFGNTVFQPLEDLELRFQLKTNSSKINAIMNALEGQVELNKRMPSTNKQYKAFRVGSVNHLKISTIIWKLVNWSGFKICNSMNNIQYGMIINPNIKQLIEWQKHHQKYDQYIDLNKE